MLLALSAFLISCGGSGHVMLYNFNGNKYDVQKEIFGVINKDSIYSVPKKWSEDTHELGDNLEYFFLYFKSSPEEMYRIQFADSASWNNSPKSCLGLISRFDGSFWKYRDDLSNKEIKRITKRFESEILSKVRYSYDKNYHNW
jgi:hypothetical protein